MNFVKLNAPFDPFGLWANPWYFLDVGLTFVRSWQDVWIARMQLGEPATGGAAGERQQLERQIAARQGRRQPQLGCLTGVEVVGGPAPAAVQPAPASVEVPAVVSPVAAEPATSTAQSVTSMLAMQARSLSKAVSRAPKADAGKPAAKKAAAKPAAKAVARPPVKPAGASAAKPAAKKAASKKA